VKEHESDGERKEDLEVTDSMTKTGTTESETVTWGVNGHVFHFDTRFNEHLNLKALKDLINSTFMELSAQIENHDHQDDSSGYYSRERIAIYEDISDIGKRWKRAHLYKSYYNKAWKRSGAWILVALSPDKKTKAGKWSFNKALYVRLMEVVSAYGIKAVQAM